MFRSYLGGAALDALRIYDHHTTVGGLIFRAGPSAERDCVCFTNGHSVGEVMPDGTFYGHVWRQIGETVIDFSCGDWKTSVSAWQMARAEALHGENPSFIQWTHGPSQFIWDRANRLKPTADVVEAQYEKDGGHVAPPLGRAWYMPLDTNSHAAAHATVHRFADWALQDVPLDGSRRGTRRTMKAILVRTKGRPFRCEVTGEGLCSYCDERILWAKVQKSRKAIPLEPFDEDDGYTESHFKHCHTRMGTTDRQPPPGRGVEMTDTIWRQLIKLVHPDKHHGGNSEDLATEIPNAARTAHAIKGVGA
jgi:hypothetical protein